MKKVLIIGKHGFVSKNLAEYFAESSFGVFRVVSSSDLDLLDEKLVGDFFSANYYDVVIDTAIYNPRVGIGKEPDMELEYDLRMFHNLAKCHDRYGKLIYFGSGAEYNKALPICSVSEDELDNLIPDNAYGMAKYIIGQEIEAGIYHADNIYNLRIFGLYGKYENWKTTFISGACCKAIFDMPITIRQNVYFDYLFIDDFCKMLDSFIRVDSPNFRTYNITSGKRSSLLEIAHIIKEISGKDLDVIVKKDGLANEYTSNNERLLKEIGGFEFEPMKKSISKLYAYYEQIKEDIDKSLIEE